MPFASSFFFALACERTFIKTHSTEKRFFIRAENILFLRHVRASFSPEILHDGAVKGLNADEVSAYSITH